MESFNEQEVRKTIAILKPNRQLFEVRVIYNSKKVLSGYFDNADSLIEALRRDFYKFDGCNFYITLNTINDGCRARTQWSRFIQQSKATTSDTDIDGYDWLMIDLDPKRPTDTSSSDEMLDKAKAMGNKIYQYMRDLGFNKPIFANSGNGVHLLYRVRLANNPNNKKLLETCLKTLDMLFTDECVSVDMKNFNPSRICKLYGFASQKGTNSEKYPHRLSNIIGNEQASEPNDIAYLKKLAEQYPQKEEPQAYNNYMPNAFDVESWLTKNNIPFKADTFSNGKKFILNECPFDSNHKGKDACVFQSNDGRIGFHCFHNSCSGKTWKDFRKLIEPTAYEKRTSDYEKRIYSKKKQTEVKHIEAKDDVPIFFTALDIFNLPNEEETFIKSGIELLDKRVRGFKKSYITVMSGLRASGKSSVISQIVLNAVDNGNNVAVFSGELTGRNFMKWLYRQAAGKSYCEPTSYEGFFTVKRKHQQQIAEWLGNRFYLYNNDYGNDFCAILEQFEQAIDSKNLDLLILDNLMAFNITSLSDNKWDAQTSFVLSLKNLAVRKNCHILFVAHPKKAMGFLRLDDISGTADIGNAVDNALIVHRVNNDFNRLSRQTLGLRDDNPVFTATNVIEIAKDRDNGTQDLLIPLYYETESKRLKNSPTENVHYGWCAKDDFMAVDDYSQIPFMD